MRSVAIALLVLIVALATPAFANLLDFSGTICTADTAGAGPQVTCGNGSYISQSYGDAANVNVTYKDLVNTGTSLRWWDANYSDLRGVAWGGGGDGAGQSNDRIEIAPTVAGNSVTLNGFDLGSYPNLSRTTHPRVVELVTGTVLIDFGAPTVPGNVHSHFNANVTSRNGVAIEWKDTGFNVGIDNIDFTVGPTAVPEPSTCALLLIGGVALMGRWSRWSRRSRRP